MSYDVNPDGITTRPIPLMGTPPDVGVGKSIKSYLELRRLIKLSRAKGQKVHHLVEVRHFKRLLLSTRKTPSVALTKTEHNGSDAGIEKVTYLWN